MIARNPCWILALACACACLAAPSRRIQTATEVGMENDVARIVFDPRTGQLTSLRNVASGDEYLKDRQADGGPFTVYSDFRGEFEVQSQGTITRPFTDPASIAGAIAKPPGCRLESSAFRRAGNGLTLALAYLDEAARWSLHVEVWLPDSSGASEWRMSITNLLPQPAVFMAGFPRISGFRLGPDGAGNMQTTLREGGGITPAWTKAGGIYGNGGQLAMQWHAIFDRPSGNYFGLIVADDELRNKW
ncbi:MAG: hypothetical protein NTY38_20145, partial [Acidobacteria bacterium]|nr:hypothetical protein [Acidobacteriota bacterium]